ncbi:unnamed protein product [Phytophthora lilii]|uniref:Unnamed protein product n=1 Tax=Phytophthora lilii TaxID=2077276 RepID=A0A9W6U0K3_9STRA|nr:unnamed protein product [Phytophthora lilii]
MVKLLHSIVGIRRVCPPRVLTVGDLKKVIKKTSNGIITVPALILQFFQANEEGGVCLVSGTDDVKLLQKGGKMALIEAQTYEDKKLTGQSALEKVLAGIPADDIQVPMVVSPLPRGLASILLA